MVEVHSGGGAAGKGKVQGGDALPHVLVCVAVINARADTTPPNGCAWQLGMPPPGARLLPLTGRQLRCRRLEACAGWAASCWGSACSVCMLLYVLPPARSASVSLSGAAMVQNPACCCGVCCAVHCGMRCCLSSTAICWVPWYGVLWLLPAPHKRLLWQQAAKGST